MKNILMVLGAVFLSVGPSVRAQKLSDPDLAYVKQVAAENAQKTGAQLITLHVKSTHLASSSELTDSQRSPDPVLGSHREYTMVVGDFEATSFRFITDDDRVGEVQVGKNYPVVVGMASLDMKKHRFNVKDRNSAVILIPNVDPKKEPTQFSMSVVEIAEK